MEVKRKIYIELGAHNGSSAKSFIDKNPDFKSYLFEPFVDCKTEGIVKKVAASTYDGTCKFYLGKTDVSGSTRSDKVKHMSDEPPIEVPCINFSNWLRQNFSIEDYIVLNMDIEGAEYDVLPHLIQTNAIDYINELGVEWHGNAKIKDLSLIMLESLKNKVKARVPKYTELNKNTYNL